MTIAGEPTLLTPAEYLVRERAAAYRSEFIEGRMVLMTGGSFAHVAIATNVSAALHEALRGGPCVALQSDMRVGVADGSFYTYPDVVVACEPVELEDSHQDTLLNPVVIVEVISPSTARHDRGEKRRRYEGIASLHHYLVVEQDRPLVEHFRRVGDGEGERAGEGEGEGDEPEWSREVVEGPEASIELDAVGVTIEMERVYEGVATGFRTPPS